MVHGAELGACLAESATTIGAPAGLIVGTAPSACSSAAVSARPHHRMQCTLVRPRPCALQMTCTARERSGQPLHHAARRGPSGDPPEPLREPPPHSADPDTRPPIPPARPVGIAGRSACRCPVVGRPPSPHPWPHANAPASSEDNGFTTYTPNRNHKYLRTPRRTPLWTPLTTSKNHLPTMITMLWKRRDRLSDSRSTRSPQT
jgi:hypothetical protein